MVYAANPNDLEEAQERATTLSTGYEIAEGGHKEANYLERIEELQEQINNLSLINNLSTPLLNKPYEQPIQNEMKRHNNEMSNATTAINLDIWQKTAEVVEATDQITPITT